jgi:hypothetical protein
VDARVGHQVGLELSDIDVQGTIETKGGGQGRDDLGNQSVKVGVGRSVDVEGSLANVIDGLIVEHESYIGVLKEGVGRKHRVVGLHHGSGHLRGWVDAEVELALLSVVDGKSLKEERSETGSCSTTNGVENEETLETSALVSQLPHSVEAEVDDLLANGIMTTGIVVRGIFLASDELLCKRKISNLSNTQKAIAKDSNDAYRGGTIDGRFQFLLHQSQWAPNPRTRHGARACQHQSRRRRC